MKKGRVKIAVVMMDAGDVDGCCFMVRHEDQLVEVAVSLEEMMDIDNATDKQRLEERVVK